MTGVVSPNEPRTVRVAVVALAVALVLSSCSGDASETSPADDGSTTEAAGPPTTTAADCRPTSGGVAQGGSVESSGVPSFVKLGPGPDITAEEAEAEAPARKGIPLLISGTVYAADCETPLAGVLIEAWQTDARGVYGPGQGNSELRCCYLQGTVKTDADGGYEIQTIRPGHYRGEESPPPAHIHLNVHHRDAGVLTEVLFAGDPYLPAGESLAEVIRLRKDGSRLVGRFDIVLAATG
jgi:protocatechuate 3,4-dioxygenase beta subunit